MRAVSLSLLVAALPLVFATPLENRAACNEDNLLRALEHRYSEAHPFCQSYIGDYGIGTVYTATTVCR
jgi:hypothetical protein